MAFLIAQKGGGGMGGGDLMKGCGHRGSAPIYIH